MKKFTIKIYCDNDAFQPDPVFELERLLRKTSAAILEGHAEGVLLDHNGNGVGHFELKDDDTRFPQLCLENDPAGTGFTCSLANEHVGPTHVATEGHMRDGDALAQWVM